MNQASEPNLLDNLLSAHSAKIKDVYIELDDYEFFHSPYAYDKPDERFIGREKIVSHLKIMLLKSDIRSGAYLITGFRGMGKTSVVRKAIYEANEAAYQERREKFGKPRLLKYGLLLADRLKAWREKRTNRFNFFLHRYLWPALRWLFNIGILGLGIFLLGYLSIYFLSLPYADLRNENWLTWPWKFFEFKLPNDFLIRMGVLILLWIILLPIIPFVLDWILIQCRKGWEFFSLHIWPTKKKEKYVSFEINLSQETVRELDILKQIARKLQDYWEETHQQIKAVENRNLYFLFRYFGGALRRKSAYADQEKIYELLIDLNNRINAQVTSQREVRSGGNLMLTADLVKTSIPFLNSSKKDALNYPIASNKEIEQDLIDILRKIDNYRNKKKRHIPLFIFAIDELDKIVPNSSTSILERESADPNFDPKDPGTTNLVRQRQEAVGNLLANLKGFLNVAMAKFIFIGGREMYDASLADIADRDSFYSSIFNDVIYVNSFFKDKIKKRAGISRMTEAYLCSLLIPRKFLNKKHKEIIQELKLPDEVAIVQQGKMLTAAQKEAFYSLKVYTLFLIYKKFGSFRIDNSTEVTAKVTAEVTIAEAVTETVAETAAETAAKNKELEIVKLMKVVSLLQNFIIYLTYRSNGSPKKLTTLIENLIVQREESFIDKANEDYLIVSKHFEPLPKKGKTKKKDRLFLRFNYSTQFEIGLTSDIYRPYIIANSRVLKSLGDKILFSSAFIMDHLLKFHSFGFSLRNLELLPEVILVNKEPNLRLYVDQLLNYLQEGYIRTTFSSLFDYKFNSIIAIELRYLSKISELGSAAFNFTLDESLQIKRHYKRVLRDLEKKYRGYEPIDGDNQFIHAISFIQNILGDLHYYDQEFDEAMIYYTEAIQSLRIPPGKDIHLITRHQFFLWLRRKLKAALTLEQIGAYDSAYSYYRTMVICIADRLQYHTHSMLFQQENHDGPTKDNRPPDATAPEIDRNPFQDIQLLYTPLLAQLGLLEKYRFDGFTFRALRKNEQEANQFLGIEKHHDFDLDLKLHNELKEQEGLPVRLYTMKADYLYNIGNLLYFKNRIFPDLNYREEYKWNKIPGLYEPLKFLASQTSKPGEKPNRAYQHYRPSVFAYLYYYRALYTIIHSHTSTIEEMQQLSLWSKCYELARPGNLYLSSSHKKLYIAALLSNIGNCVLTFLHCPITEINIEVLNIKNFNDLGGILQKLPTEEESMRPWTITAVLALYRLSSFYYLRADQLYAHSFQLRKLLYTVKDYIQLYKVGKEEKPHPFIGQPEKSKKLLENCELIATNVARATSWNNDIANRPQILKFRDVLNIDLQARKTYISDIMHNLAGMQPAKEAILLVEDIRLKIAPEQCCRPMLSFTSSYSSISNKFLRMQELRYLSDYYYALFRNCDKSPEHPPENSDSKDDEKILEHLFKYRMVYQEKRYRSKTCKEYYDHIKEAIKKAAPRMLNASAQKINNLNEKEAKELIVFLISESIACKHEVIKIIHIYTPGYIANYNFLASAHYKLARWCRFFENIHFLEEKLDFKDKDPIYPKVLEKVVKKINNNNLIYLDSNHHFELANQAYYRATQMHTEGRTYRIEARKLFFLEDDYNDQLKHFSAATERYRMNIGETKRKIDEIRKIAQKISILYQYEYYFPKDEEQ